MIHHLAKDSETEADQADSTAQDIQYTEEEKTGTDDQDTNSETAPLDDPDQE